MATIALSGERLPPAIVAKGSAADNGHMIVSTVVVTSDVVRYGNFYYFKTPDSYVTGDVFYEYLKRLRGMVGHDKWIMLISDGHSSRHNINVYLLAANLRIMLLFEPNNSSHYLQALDAVFNLVHRDYNDVSDISFRTTRRGHSWLVAQRIVQGLSDTLGKMDRSLVFKNLLQSYTALTPEVVRSGWRKVGLDPVAGVSPANVHDQLVDLFCHESTIVDDFLKATPSTRLLFGQGREQLMLNAMAAPYDKADLRETNVEKLQLLLAEARTHATILKETWKALQSAEAKALRDTLSAALVNQATTMQRIKQQGTRKATFSTRQGASASELVFAGVKAEATKRSKEAKRQATETARQSEDVTLKCMQYYANLHHFELALDDRLRIKDLKGFIDAVSRLDAAGRIAVTPKELLSTKGAKNRRVLMQQVEDILQQLDSFSIAGQLLLQPLSTPSGPVAPPQIVSMQAAGTAAAPGADSMLRVVTSGQDTFQVGTMTPQSLSSMSAPHVPFAHEVTPPELSTSGSAQLQASVLSQLDAPDRDAVELYLTIAEGQDHAEGTSTKRLLPT